MSWLPWDAGDSLAVIQFIDRVREAFPAYEEETTVVVHGNSNSRIQDLYNQALAIAFGQTKNVFLKETPTPFMADAQFDLMNKSVTVTLRYMFSGMLSQNPAAALDAIKNAMSVFNFRMFGQPPADNVRPGRMNNTWFDAVAPNVPGLKACTDSDKPAAWGAPGDIAAGNPSAKANWIPGSGPGGANTPDAGVRGTFLEKLVYSALAVPCINNDFWRPVRGNPRIRIFPGDNTQSSVPPGTPPSNSYAATITGLTSDIYTSLSTQPAEAQQDPNTMLNGMLTILNGVG